MSTVGFVGLGTMGGPVAGRLFASGQFLARLGGTAAGEHEDPQGEPALASG
jgi:3-hydroxyisobutyrate dehydrogenase-like beta-hydroxyacid dehydrogenase